MKSTEVNVKPCGEGKDANLKRSQVNDRFKMKNGGIPVSAHAVTDDIVQEEWHIIGRGIVILVGFLIFQFRFGLPASCPAEALRAQQEVQGENDAVAMSKFGDKGATVRCRNDEFSVGMKGARGVVSVSHKAPNSSKENVLRVRIVHGPKRKPPKVLSTGLDRI